MSKSSKELAEQYFHSWKNGDFETFKSLLDNKATFKGPLGQANNADECVKGIKGMYEIMKDIRIIKILADETDVITWYDLHTKDGKVLATANWTHIKNGKITKIHAAFDPRSLLS